MMLTTLTNQERSQSIKVSLAWSEIDKKGGRNYFILYKTELLKFFHFLDDD